MKKLWICMLISTFLGFGSAWAINYQRFGHRSAWFGPFGTESSLTPDGLDEYLQQQLPEGRPIVELVGDSTYDFGIMAPDTKGEHTFVIKNVGNDDLRLRLGASTCKCTFGDLQREVLAPGEQTEVKLNWLVKSGELDFSQSAEVLTNDPKRVAIRFAVFGKVIEDVDIVPETWTFGEVATGEPMEVTGTLYSFLDNDILPTEMKFSSEEMTALSEFDVEEFEPTEENDGIRSVARQGFRVTAKIKPGMRQGAVSQNLLFSFNQIDESGEPIKAEDGEGTDADHYVIAAPVKGAIVGPLSMILSSRLQGEEGGGYLYDFGRIKNGDSLVAKTLVVLKGTEQGSTELRVGKTEPEGVVKATLGEPKGQGSMKVFPLEIELIPGSEPVERLGKSSDDYGSVWIESDNPKVTKMRIGLKFAIEAK